MDSELKYKKEGINLAGAMITERSSVGLGDGSTILMLAEMLVEKIKQGLQISLYTSSLKTQVYLMKSGVQTLDIQTIDSLDIYFDGCDQVDADLNAFKSGSGIHTSEKLLASMAKKFVLLADASKFVNKMSNRFPLVLEILPRSENYVMNQMKTRFPGISLSIRKQEDSGNLILTRDNNYLVDCYFDILPELSFLQICKNITGVVDHSLFFELAHELISFDKESARKLERLQMI